MFATLRSTIARTLGFAPWKRALDSASGGPRWRDDRSGGAAVSWIQTGAATVAARAQAFALNNAHGAKIVETQSANFVGSGIVPRAQISSEGVRTRLNGDWNAYIDNADAEGLTDLYGIQANVVRDLVIFGEAIFMWTEDARTVTPQLLRLHPEQLDRSKTSHLPDGGWITQGVEFGPDGRRRAYWIRPYVPGSLMPVVSLASERYPASDIIHVFRQLVPGQVRGLSWFAPILLSANDLAALIDAAIVRTKVAAMFVGSIVDVDGDGPGMDGVQTGAKLDVTAEPGSIRVESPNKKLEWNDPPDTGNVAEFAREMLRMLATGAGVTYEQISGDFSQVNYSSARAALLEYRRFVDAIQNNVLIFQFCRPVWQRFVRWEVLRGAISATAYRADPLAFESAKWLPPRWQWVDPLKDSQAAILEIEHGLTSRSQVIAERGFDAETLDAEIAADQARADRLGLKLGGGIPLVKVPTNEAA